MKSLIANMIKKKNSKVQAQASMSKEFAGKNKSKLDQVNNKPAVIENKEIIKESRTLMLD